MKSTLGLSTRPMLLWLALSATLAMVAISDSSSWSGLQASPTTLARLGVALAGAISLLALWMVWRQSVALQALQQERHTEARTEHIRLEAEVLQRTAQLTALAHHLQTEREDERQRLARDLHDELGALLTSAKLDAARIRSRLAGTAPEALERLAHLVQTLDSVIALKRSITEDLRPSALGHLGLAATLEILMHEFSARSGVAVHCAWQTVRLGPAAELTVYRVVQEAVTNISKYAQARQVWVDLTAQGDMAEVSVRDDGIGFDTSAPRRSSYGLLGMRYRIEAEHGSLSILSAPGQGTTILVRLPQAPPQALPQTPSVTG